MRILLTETGSPLGSALSAQLADTHQVTSLPQGADPFEPDVAWRGVRGVDAVVHTGVPVTPGSAVDGIEGERARLDESTRGVHVLCDAATQAGVRRLVYCSSLRLFERYPDDRYVSEEWRPDPGTDSECLRHHLAEQVTREFARDRPLSVTVLRLGTLQREDDVPAGATPDLMWLDPRDAAAAVASALAAPDRSSALDWQSRWQPVHICARPPLPKYLPSRRLAFEPQHNFAAAWAGRPA